MYEEVKIEMPDEVSEEESIASITLLPTKTKERYEKEYEDFVTWRKNANIKCVDETVLLSYVKEKSEVYSPNSMWTKISMLKLALKVFENIDISGFSELFSFLKQTSDGYKPKKVKILSEEQVTKFLLEADDTKWLLEKVILILGIFGACRCHEIVSLTLDDFEENSQNVRITLRSKLKKNRSFVIPKEGIPFDAYGLYRKYSDLRPVDLESRRFLIGYRTGKCIKNVVGYHTVGNVPKKIAMYLNAENPELYTAHSFWRSSPNTLENEADPLSMNELGGWNLSSLADTYVKKSVSKRMKITKELINTENTEAMSSSSTTANTITNGEVPLDELQISNNSNCVFNIHIHYHDK